ncbi:hypothetical protein BGZ59_009952 [Podila verticillata]|nr:hypothetical protein BGZ59_009952 [Podila verticillata]
MAISGTKNMTVFASRYTYALPYLFVEISYLKTQKQRDFFQRMVMFDWENEVDRESA